MKKRTETYKEKKIGNSSSYRKCSCIALKIGNVNAFNNNMAINRLMTGPTLKATPPLFETTGLRPFYLR